MKRLLFLLLFGFCIAHSSMAQVKIGDNPQNIDAASVLELESSDKVLVITRVTTVQMNAIAPLQGAMVYNTDVQSVHYYDGTQWVNIGGGGGTGGPLTADPIINDISTIVITPTVDGDNLEVAPKSIGTPQIQNGSIGADQILDNSVGFDKIQDQSVTQAKLSENSVGAFALDNDNIGLEAFSNNLTQYITAANVVSPDSGNVLESRVNGVFYNDESLLTAINQNTDAIALDNDQSSSNEIQNLSLDPATDILSLSGSTNTIDLSTYAGGGGNSTDELTDISFNTTTNILTLSNPATAAGGTADLSSLAGSGGATVINSTATVTVAGTGTGIDPYELTAVGVGGNQNLGQVLTTGNDGGASLIKNILNPVDPQDAATRAYVDAAVTSGGSLQNGTILIGDASNAAQQLAVAGDATLANNGVLTVSTDAITTGKILNSTILAEDLSAMGATSSGQVLKWNGTAWAPATDNTSTAALNNGNIYVGDSSDAPQGVVMYGDATIDNTGALTIADDAVELNMIAQNGATNGDVMRWNNTSSEWEVGTSASHTGEAKNVFFAAADGSPIDTKGNDVAGTPTTLRDNGGFFWDSSRRFNTGALYLGLKGNGNDQGTSVIESNPLGQSKLILAEKYNASSGEFSLAFPLQLRNESTTAGTGTGILFAVNTTGLPGNGALVFQRETGENDGDFHFLVRNAADGERPAFSDKVLTIENDGDIMLTGNLFDKNDDPLNPTPTGYVLTNTTNGTEWAAATGGTTLTDADTNDGLTTYVAATGYNINVDGTTIELNADALRIKPATGALPLAEDQILVTDKDSGTISWEDLPSGSTAPTDSDANDGLTTYAAATGYNINVDGTTIELNADALRIKPATGALPLAEDQILVTDKDSGAISWEDLPTGGQNLATDNLTQDAESRTYNMAGETLTFSNAKIGIGTGSFDTDVDVALQVFGNGQIRAGSFKAADGAANLPSYRFANDVNSGMFLPNGGDELGFSTEGVEVIRIDENQKVGIGITNPTELMHVGGNMRTEGIIKNSDGNASAPSYGFENDNDMGMYFKGFDQLAFATSGIETLLIDASQEVGIGIGDPLEKLHVAGNIRADGDFISNNTTIQIPDYVFHKYFLGKSDLKLDYDFENLQEIEKFVKKYHHLPGIRSAKQVEKDGLWNISKSNLQNLEKIEELFLHTIEQEHKIKKLESENQILSDELKSIQKDLKEIKALLKNK